MAEDGLNDYERLRQDNIRRNEAKLVHLRRKADELSAAIRLAKPKRAYQVKPRPPPSGPVRSSLRSRGISPTNLPPDLKSTRLSPSLASSILAGAPPPPPEEEEEGAKIRDFDAGRDMVLKPAHVRKVVPWNITSLRVLPLVDRTVVAAGDKLGNVAFWDVDGAADGVVFRYWPHKGHVSAIVAHQAAPHKVYSSSRQGEICLMDFKEENFSIVHLWEWPVNSLCQAQDSVRCLYFGDGKGGLTLSDDRVGKVLTTWDAHDDRINSIDFHPEKTHVFATSSDDGTACIWDVRNMKRKDPDSLKVFKLDRSARSAYFSPSGRLLAVTSSKHCGTVQVFSVDDFEKTHAVEYNNQTDSWSYKFMVIWGWNDTDLYVGNTSKGIDIISVDVDDSGLSALRLNNACLRSEHLTNVPCQLSAHPYKVGYLACSNSNSSKVFLWTRA